MPVSIRSRLLLLVLSVLVPAMLGVGWLIAHTFKAERQANERALRDTARALSTLVDRELSQRAARVRLLAQSRWLDDAPLLTPLALARFEQQARVALRELDGWIELRAAGQTLLDTRHSDRPLPATASDGLVDVAQMRPLQVGDGMQGAYAALVEPVERDGKTVLNLVLTLKPVELQRIVDAQTLPDDRVAAVLDSRGVVVARQPGGAAYIGRSATPDLQARLVSSREGLFESTSLDGRAMVGYYSTSPQGWTYVSAMSSEQFAGLLPQAVMRVLAGALVLLALAVVGALWVSRRIVAPVQALKVAAARLQSGDVIEAHTTGIVECDEVATALADSSKVIRDARHDLERQVAQAVERTRIAEQRVSQSQRVEALGRLTGGVAHDFNNLLGVISNSAHLIERHATTPQLQLPVSATLRAVEAGSRLTQHLLSFAGQRPVRPQALHLELALPDLKELMRSVVGRTIAISLDVAPGTWAVQVDPGEFELALVNLTLNARDAMPSGGTLQLRARNADSDDAAGLPPGRYVLVSVGDDGLGMPPEATAHAFEPFFTTKAVGKGTGLGLSQVHGFCVQAGGTARVASTPGVGTTVLLLLPASANTAVTQDASAASPPAPGAAAITSALAGARVLLVDDNEALAKVTAPLLQAHGAHVECTDNAADALQRITQAPGAFDLVLSDIVMPGAMDGLGLARRLRRDHPALPVVLLSGFSVAEAARDFVVLRKPCPEREMLGALTDALRAAKRSPP